MAGTSARLGGNHGTYVGAARRDQGGGSRPCQHPLRRHGKSADSGRGADGRGVLDRRIHGEEGRRFAPDVPQAGRRPDRRRRAEAGAVPGARVVERRPVELRPARARQGRILDDERVRPARLRRLDDGPRGLRQVVAHLRQFRHRERRRRTSRPRCRPWSRRPAATRCTCTARPPARSGPRAYAHGRAGAGRPPGARPPSPTRARTRRPCSSGRSSSNTTRPTTPGCATAP